MAMDNPDPVFARKSVVSFTLAPTETGTHLRMEQSGFRPDARFGWARFLDALDGLLGRDPAGETM